MVQSRPIPASDRRALSNAARDLHDQFSGVFGIETIEALVLDSYTERASTATVTRWLVAGAERFARERLEALAHAQMPPDDKVPAVLFLCTHNAGRSQMALGWFTHLAGDHAIAWSGGSEPESEINKAAVVAMDEVDIDISAAYPKPWTDEVVAAADVVVTMGCGDACPLVPGKRYEDWEVEDPSGLPLSFVRPIRDDIERRVRDLLSRLQIEPSSSRSGVPERP
jgi:arsenate reductase (thioredoxin)